jgi:hypothetical protein
VEAKDPLSDLADIHLPAAVSAWPPAPLWWLLAALVLAALAAAVAWLYRRWLLRKRMQVALDEITAAQTLWQRAQDAESSLALLHTCNSVLKRVALVHYPESEVAALHGRTWLSFLDQSGSTTEFSNGAAQILADHSYRRSYNADAETAKALVATVHAWISRQYQHPPRRAVVTLQESPA